MIIVSIKSEDTSVLAIIKQMFLLKTGRLAVSGLHGKSYSMVVIQGS